MSSKSLTERYESIKERECASIQDAHKIITKTSALADESNRVSEVAKHSEAIINEIENDFASSTQITNPTDMAFLGVAIALQCLRWFLLNGRKRNCDHRAGGCCDD